MLKKSNGLLRYTSENHYGGKKCIYIYICFFFPDDFGLRRAPIVAEISYLFNKPFFFFFFVVAESSLSFFFLQCQRYHQYWCFLAVTLFMTCWARLLSFMISLFFLFLASHEERPNKGTGTPVRSTFPNTDQTTHPPLGVPLQLASSEQCISSDKKCYL